MRRCFIGGSTPMPSAEGRPIGILLVAIPALITVTGMVLRSLPAECATILALWICFSLPLGIGVGHCFLSEE